MTPIQTSYKGYLFRSRLEARWAVFFQGLGLDWEYEVEGFQLADGTMYLPDFKINIHIDKAYPDLDPEERAMMQDFAYYIEVKPRNITSDKKFESFNAEYPCSILVSGDPTDMTPLGEMASTYNGFDFFLNWCGYWSSVTHAGYRVPCNEVIIAASYARSARFEHGETP